MAHDASAANGAGKLVIRNIGLLLSGAIEAPILDADTIVAVDGRITAIGRAEGCGRRRTQPQLSMRKARWWRRA